MVGAIYRYRAWFVRIVIFVAALLFVSLLYARRAETADAIHLTQGCTAENGLKAPLVVYGVSGAGVGVRNLDGSCSHVLDTNGTSAGRPRYSEDGRYIYFLSGPYLFRINGWGGGTVQLDNGKPYEGKFIYIAIGRNNDCNVALMNAFTDASGSHPAGIYNMDPSGAPGALVTETAGATFRDVQCKGGQVVFSMRNASGGYEIRTVDINSNGNGTNPQNVTPDDPTADRTDPQYSPDGNCVAWVKKDSGGAYHLYQQCPGDDDPVEVGSSQSGDQMYSASYTPDGCYMVYLIISSDPSRTGQYRVDLCHGGDTEQISGNYQGGEPSIGPMLLDWIIDLINGSCGGNCPSGGDPVNLAAGKMGLSEVDLAVSSSGPRLALGRHYNNRTLVSDTMGLGWRIGFDQELTAVNTASNPKPKDPNAVNGATWTRDDGRKDFFKLSGSTYNPPSGGHEVVKYMTDHFEATDTASLVYRFDTSNRLEAVRDRFGSGYDIGRDAAGRTKDVTHTAGPSIHLTYNTTGQISGATTSDGGEASYTYHASGLLATATKDGQVTTYGYNIFNRLASITDNSGKVIFTQDYRGTAPIAQRDGRGNGDDLAYYVTPTAPGAGYAVVTSPEGNETTATWNTKGFETSRTDPVGAVTSYGYSSKGDRAQITDATGAATQTLYDTAGNPTSVTDPNGSTWSSTYRPDRQPSQTTDPTGQSTTFAYLDNGALSSYTSPGGASSIYWTNADGTVTATMSPDGVISRTEYDGRGRPVRSIDADNRSTYTVYNADGTVSSTIGPNGATTSTTYDTAKRPVVVTDPLGATSGFGYDAAGNQNTVTDSNGNVVNFGYDSAYNLYETSTTIEGPGVVKADFSYDSSNRLVGVTAPGASGTSSYSYLPTGSLQATRDPDQVTTSYGYSARGELITATAPDGTTSSFTYDGAGHLTGSTNSKDGSVTYSYDEAGRATQVVDEASRSTMMLYDDAKRPTGAIDTVVVNPDATIEPFGVTSTLSPGGRRATEGRNKYTYENYQLTPAPGGSQIQYRYSDDGSLYSITSEALVGDGALTNTYSPTTGRLDTTSAPGSSLALGYDLAGRQNEATWTLGPGQVGLAYPTRYDAAGNVISVGNSTYTHDGLGRMVTATDPDTGDTYSYSYDLASNRTTVTKNSQTIQELTFTTADKIDTATSPGFAYDPAGRLISDTTDSGDRRHYSWDGHGRLSGIDRYRVADGQYENLRASYDSSGRIVEKTTYIDLSYPVEHLWYHYDGDRLIGEEDMTGTVREYLYAGGEAPTAMRSRNPDGSYSNFFFVTNTHGDVVAVTDKDGNIVNRYAYGPWGEATRVSEQVHQPFRYAGYRYEDGFDLYYLRARWYDSGTGRFLSRDPDPASANRLVSLNQYIYVHNSPPTNTDPDGRSPVRPNQKCIAGVLCNPGVFKTGKAYDLWCDAGIARRFEEGGTKLRVDIGWWCGADVRPEDINAAAQDIFNYRLERWRQERQFPFPSFWRNEKDVGRGDIVGEYRGNQRLSGSYAHPDLISLDGLNGTYRIVGRFTYAFTRGSPPSQDPPTALSGQFECSNGVCH